MTKQILKECYKQAIKEDMDLQVKICKANEWAGKPVTFRTLVRWLATDSEKLTTATTLQVIREHLGLVDVDLTEVRKPAAEAPRAEVMQS